MDINKILTELKNQIAEKNINFLIGSGASIPYFPSLGNIEKVLSEKVDDNSSIRKLIYLHYFNKVVDKNIELLDETYQCEFAITPKYRVFINRLCNIMNARNSRISPKRANIFTTNYDVFFEKAIDLELKDNPSFIFNDGGSGYFTRNLNSENFHKTVSKNGVFDNYQKELSTINLIKCHGSVTWDKLIEDNEEKIEIKMRLSLLEKVRDAASNLTLTKKDQEIISDYLNLSDSEDVESNMMEIAERNKESLERFFNEYKKLMIVNPEKSKFKNTVLDEYYYSMLRLLSYELEKDQTILIVFGFSFADEHIRNLIKRSLHNPYLRVYIFVYKQGDASIIEKLLSSAQNNNVVIIEPSKDMPPIDFMEFNELLFGSVVK
ncbi:MULTISPECIES: SIR2 family protein [Paraliobacillus]|uniref:SIR2 family protein n=1 Tax=Paraliobacillus TaxID=200903 RepID=UPI000DD4CF83|nr:MULTISPECIES: SIR2 family protein [Paraliobacillus]